MADTMAEEKKAPKATGESGTDPKLLAFLAYVFSLLGGIIVFVISKDKFAKFHAMQAILLGIIMTVCSITIILIPIAGLVWLYGLYIGIVYAYKGQKYKIPYIGEYAEKYSA